MNTQWLLENAGYPVRYSLTHDASYIAPMMENEEVKSWFERLSNRMIFSDLSNIHGSHGYRYENIIGKCFILGLDSQIPIFDSLINFFVSFLDKHITEECDEKLTFGKIYHYRDYETIIACYLPFLGYAQEKSVRYIADKRVNLIYEFTRENRYDIYRSELVYSGAKKEWRPYILDPALYHDGNIRFPSIHDLILFAGMYPYFDEETRTKAETTIKWIFGDGYSSVHGQLYYYAPDDPSYKSKGINSKIHLHDFSQPEPKDMQSLLFHCFLFSHFQEAKKSKWFSDALTYLNNYKTESGCYIFPKEMITEQKDSYVTGGGHMNPGESKKNKKYAEILSTFWMEKILANLSQLS